MAVEWVKASDDVIETAQHLIDEYHPGLEEARIAFLFRGDNPMSGGKRVYGNASKVSAQWKPLLTDEFDFVIWLVYDEWKMANKKQRKAMLDHQLCHCVLENGEASIKGHDIEEFTAVIARWGEWQHDLEDVGRAFRQEPLLNVPSGRQGKLVAVDIPFTANPKVDHETGEILTDEMLDETARQMNALFDDVEVTVSRGR